MSRKIQLKAAKRVMGARVRASPRERRRLRVPRIICVPLLSVVLGSLLGLLIYHMEAQRVSLPAEGLRREEYGGNARQIQLEVSGLGEEAERLVFTLNPRLYTETEGRQLLENTAQQLGAQILGENQTLSEVSRSLRLPELLPGSGISLNWQFEPLPPENISEEEAQAYRERYRHCLASDGSLNTELLEAGEPVQGALTVEMQLDVMAAADTSGAADSGPNSVAVISSPDGAAVEPEHSEVKRISHRQHFSVTLLAPQRSAAEHVRRRLARYLAQAEREGMALPELPLPQEFEGRHLSYQYRHDRTYLYLPILGLLFGLAYVLYEKQQKKEGQKKRERQLLLSYADFVTQINLYLGAGYQLRNIIPVLCGKYEGQLKRRDRRHQLLFGELLECRLQMEKGMSETEVYRLLAQRIGLRPYRKLLALLEQNRKNGSRNLREMLDTEMQLAFQERKSMAKLQGEEASTKLLLPLFLMLALILLMVTLPALLML